MIVPCNDKHIKNIFYSFNINIWSPSFQSYEPSLYRSINYLFKLLYGVIRVYITIKNHTYICHTLIFLVYCNTSWMILQLLHGPICPNKAMIKVSVTLGSRLPTYLKIEKKCNTQYTSFITKPHWKKIFKLSDEIYLFQRICFIKIQMVCWARERD